TSFASGWLDAAPISTKSAPPARRSLACASAAAASRYRPPSEKESSVTLRMPTIFAPRPRSDGSCALARRSAPKRFTSGLLQPLDRGRSVGKQAEGEAGHAGERLVELLQRLAACAADHGHLVAKRALLVSERPRDHAELPERR